MWEILLSEGFGHEWLNPNNWDRSEGKGEENKETFQQEKGQPLFIVRIVVNLFLKFKLIIYYVTYQLLLLYVIMLHNKINLIQCKFFIVVILDF